MPEDTTKNLLIYTTRLLALLQYIYIKKLRCDKQAAQMPKQNA
jgi:hypothetical protein